MNLYKTENIEKINNRTSDNQSSEYQVKIPPFITEWSIV